MESKAASNERGFLTNFTTAEKSIELALKTLPKEEEKKTSADKAALKMVPDHKG